MTPTITTPTPFNTLSLSYKELKKATPKMVKSTTVAVKAKESQECPIFLRKTYHMIDTCDPDVASWSEDGETFVVKQPEVFETKIIPQFFKHSKFSSFVRQLNFYGFRKIKYSDTIKIDPKLEAETANFWRFRHDKFQRGKPEILVEIKRSNSQSVTQSVEKEHLAVALEEKPEDVSFLKTEVTSLKERIASMTKNIDNLTTLVQNLAVAEKEPNVKAGRTDEVGAKRKKLQPILDNVLEDLNELNPAPSRVSDNICFTPGTIFPSSVTGRQLSDTSQISDEAFVDELFTAFGGDDGLDGFPDVVLSNDILEAESASFMEVEQPSTNSPDPLLMKKLSDALALLPKDIQEMLVNRLIATITTSDALKSHIDAVTSCASQVKSEEQFVSYSSQEQDPDVALSLAAATLGALLAQYSITKEKSFMTKSLPVIPMHA